MYILVMLGILIVSDMQIGEVEIKNSTGFSQAAENPGGAVKVSLHDCLACSGCVTSAETVLLQHQSIDEFRSRLANPSYTVVVSLSPQSVVSLAIFYGFEPAVFVGKLVSVLKAHGVAAVFDIAWSREISLIETAREFIDRYRDARQGCLEASKPGDIQGERLLPMLASACPGWICYAEKTHGNFVLPYISTTKSPQAILGTLIKRFYSGTSSDLDMSRVYHCAVMPCYDKKLEASRDDFVVPGSTVAETDCVLATTELHEWIQSLYLNLADIEPLPFDHPFTNQVSEADHRSFGLSGGAGGYLEYVARTAARDILGVELPRAPLSLTQGRNADVKYYTIEVDGRSPLRFARAYGFRNIQGMMRKLKLRKCEYDFIEIMACPSGCLNGGGQMKVAQGERAEDLIERLETAYHSEAYLSLREPHENESVALFYRDVVQADPGSIPARSLLHTGYHAREKTVQAAISDW